MPIHDPEQSASSVSHQGEDSHDAPPLHQLEAELYATKMQLQTMNEAYATLVEELKIAKEFEKVVDTVRESLLILTPDLQVHSANQSFYTHFQVTPEETEGQHIYTLGNHQWDIPEFHRLLEEVLPQNKVFNDFEVTHNFERIGRQTLLLNGRRLDHVEFILVAIEDFTERKRTDEALNQFIFRLEEQVTQRTAQVRALASTLTLVEQEERQRIAQILHDDLQQLLYGIQIRLLSILKAVGSDSTVATYVQEAYTWLDDAIRIARQLTVDLSPPLLKEEGLTEALRWLGTRITATHGLQVEIRSAHAFRLPDENLRGLLFQLVRELLFNVVKHAATDRAIIELQADEAGALQLTVSDAGRGFDVTQALANQAGGFGLFSVRERLGLFGGRMDMASTSGHGSRITLTVPVAGLSINA